MLAECQAPAALPSCLFLLCPSGSVLGLAGGEPGRREKAELGGRSGADSAGEGGKARVQGFGFWSKAAPCLVWSKRFLKGPEGKCSSAL